MFNVAAGFEAFFRDIVPEETLSVNIRKHLDYFICDQFNLFYRDQDILYTFNPISVDGEYIGLHECFPRAVFKQKKDDAFAPFDFSIIDSA